MSPINEIMYTVSARHCTHMGYHSKRGTTGIVRVNACEIWKGSPSVEKFTRMLCFITLLETICIHRAFNKVHVKNRCKPITIDTLRYDCVVDWVATEMWFRGGRTDKEDDD